MNRVVVALLSTVLLCSVGCGGQDVDDSQGSAAEAVTWANSGRCVASAKTTQRSLGINDGRSYTRAECERRLGNIFATTLACGAQTRAGAVVSYSGSFGNQVIVRHTCSSGLRPPELRNYCIASAKTTQRSLGINDGRSYTRAECERRLGNIFATTLACGAQTRAGAVVSYSGSFGNQVIVRRICW